jgi:ankyrin repeat protein
MSKKVIPQNPHAKLNENLQPRLEILRQLSENPRALIKKDINMRWGDDLYYLLHHAVLGVIQGKYDYSIINNLIDKGAKTDVQGGPDFVTPAHIAQNYGRRDIVATLESRGANLSIKNKSGISVAGSMKEEKEQAFLDNILNESGLPSGSIRIKSSEQKEQDQKSSSIFDCLSQLIGGNGGRTRN